MRWRAYEHAEWVDFGRRFAFFPTLVRVGGSGGQETKWIWLEPYHYAGQPMLNRYGRVSEWRLHRWIEQ